jgi:hypothetical protein
LDDPLEKVLEEGRLIPPEAISARVVVHLSCHSAFLGCEPIDPAWGMLPGLAINLYIGALVTTPDLTFHRGGNAEKELAQYLKGGATVRDALVKFLENPTIRELGYRPLIFGDPLVRGGSSASPLVMRRDSASVQILPARSAPAAKALTGPHASDIELIRGLTGPLAVKDQASADTSARMMEQLSEYEDAEGDEVVVKEAELQASVLRHLTTAKPRLWHGWIEIAHVEQLDDLECCPNCSWTGRPRFITFPSGGEREFFSCVSCSEVFDRPVEEPGLEVSTQPPIFILQDGVDRTKSMAAVYVYRTAPQEVQTIKWPLEDQQCLQRQMMLDLASVEPGPVFIYVLLMKGLSLHARTFRVQGLASEAAIDDER